LLAVASFNAAGLAAARNIERRNQLLPCLALGASVGDLARLHLVEVGALAVTAAALSVVLAKVLLVQTLAVLPESMLLGAPPSIAGRAVLHPRRVVRRRGGLARGLYPSSRSCRAKPRCR
jgi:hypothetical protein